MTLAFYDKVRERMPIEGKVSLDEAIRTLRGFSFDPDRQFYEFDITTVSPQGIRGLSELPYETTLTLRDESLILATGLQDFVGIFGEPHVKRMKSSRIAHHVHPNSNTPVTTPSFSDVWALEESTQDYQSLSHPEGVILYRKPVPDLSATWPDYTKNLTASFGHRQNFAFLPGIRGLRHFQSLSDQEQIDLQRKFAEEHGVIVREAPWIDEKESSEILKNIFGKFLSHEMEAQRR